MDCRPVIGVCSTLFIKINNILTSKASLTIIQLINQLIILINQTLPLVYCLGASNQSGKSWCK